MANWICKGVNTTTEEDRQQQDEFDANDKSKVVAVIEMVLRRIVRLEDWEKHSYSATDPAGSWSSDAEVGGWFASTPRCITHNYTWNNITGKMIEFKQIETASTWTIIGVTRKVIPEPSEPGQSPEP